MAKEIIKLKKGDAALIIREDGKVEMNGLNDRELVNSEGHISPIILFAACWAKKDDKLLCHLVKNFQDCVREGFFGEEARRDMEKIDEEAGKENVDLSQTQTAASPDEAVKLLNDNNITPDQAEDFLKTVSPKQEKKSPVVPKKTAGNPLGLEPNCTPEEWAKGEEEKRLLDSFAKNADPRVKRQNELLKKGATVKETKDFDLHKQEDLPIEQTFAYQEATPEEQKRMKEEQKKIIGTATIEEKKDNEDK